MIRTVFEITDNEDDPVSFCLSEPGWVKISIFGGDTLVRLEDLRSAVEKLATEDAVPMPFHDRDDPIDEEGPCALW